MEGMVFRLTLQWGAPDLLDFGTLTSHSGQALSARLDSGPRILAGDHKIVALIDAVGL